MSIQIKNQLFQALPITDNKGRTYMMSNREKRIFENLDINNLPKPIQGLQRKNYIKIKEA